MSLKIYISHIDLKYDTSSQILYLSILIKILLVFYPMICITSNNCGICHTLVPAGEIKASESKPHRNSGLPSAQHSQAH